MTNEVQFVLECLRAQPLAGPCDWAAVRRAASAHDLSSLLYWRLKDQPIPEPLLSDWRESFVRNCDRNLRLLGELIQVNRALESKGMRPVVLKGPVLATLLYGHAGLRECHDLDLLVQRDEIPAAVQALREMGYRPIPESNGALERTFARYNAQMAFRSDASGAVIDLHWALTPPNLSIRFAPAEFRCVEIGGAALRTLTPEYTILVAAIHGGKHGWTTLAWVADLAAMTEVFAPDWQAVWRSAQSAGAARMLLVALALARDLFAARLPEFLESRIAADRRVQRLSSNFHAQLTGEAPAPEVFSRSLLGPLQLIEGFGAKTRFLAMRIVEPTELDWETWKMPNWLFPLYRLVRPLRLLLKYGTAPLRRTSSSTPAKRQVQAAGSGTIATKA